MQKTIKTLLVFTLFSILLLFFRIHYTHSLFYGFLLWNLFLAFIPFVISIHISRLKNKIAQFILFPLWLLFLPNAGYIITDFLHLYQGKAMPIWYDFILILSFTITGMLFFFLSINEVFLYIKRQFSLKKAWFFTVFVFFLSSFGIYLGRYLRWNSWDIIYKPHFILYDISTRIIHPTHHPRTWMMTFSFGIFFSVLFFVLRKKKWIRVDY